jgi:hypothetical protein
MLLTEFVQKLTEDPSVVTSSPFVGFIHMTRFVGLLAVKLPTGGRLYGIIGN